MINISLERSLLIRSRSYFQIPGWNRQNQGALLKCYCRYVWRNVEESARESGVPMIMQNYLTQIPAPAFYYRDNELLFHIHRAMHAVIDRQRNYGIHFRVLAKALRMSGGERNYSKQTRRETRSHFGFRRFTPRRLYYIEKDRSRGIYFTQDWVRVYSPTLRGVSTSGTCPL